MSLISIDDKNVQTFVSEGELFDFEPEIRRCDRALLEGTGAGSDFLGWLRLPSKTTEASLIRIESAAAKIREIADINYLMKLDDCSLILKLRPNNKNKYNMIWC